MSAVAQSTGLAPREQKVLRHIEAGFAYQQTARRTPVSQRTVETHLVHSKHTLMTKTEMIRFAVRLGLD